MTDNYEQTGNPTSAFEKWKGLLDTEATANPLDLNPIVGECSQCKLILRRVMHYSCQKSECPIFLKARF